MSSLLTAPTTTVRLLLLCGLLFLSPAHSNYIADIPFRDLTTFERLQNVRDTAFGFTVSGHISVNVSNADPDTNIIFALCRVSDALVRATSFQRRQWSLSPGPSIITKDIEDILCGAASSKSVKCYPFNNAPSLSLPPTPVSSKSIGLPETDMYILSSSTCNNTSSSSSNITVSISMTNPQFSYPHLGFEEAFFPSLSITVIVITSLCLLCLSYSAVSILCVLSRPPTAILFLLVPVVLKLTTAIVTFLYFTHVGRSGLRSNWYTYIRIIFSLPGDVATVVTVTVIASGVFIIPTSWRVATSYRSPVLVIYISLLLEVVNFVLVKVMFPVRYLGATTYLLVTFIITVVTVLSARRHRLFLKRYMKLVEAAYIVVASTPLPRMASFYRFTIPVVITLNLIKGLSVFVLDQTLNRPDLYWGVMELVDAVALLWLTAFVSPLRYSSLYVDMSQLNDERLEQGEAFRTSLRGGADTTGGDRVDELGSAERGTVGEIQWVRWHSGMELPLPRSETWSGVERRRAEGVRVYMLPATIVLGSPTGSGETALLEVGVPVVGPLTRPAVFDEKGMCASDVASANLERLAEETDAARLREERMRTLVVERGLRGWFAGVARRWRGTQAEQDGANGGANREEGEEGEEGGQDGMDGTVTSQSQTGTENNEDVESDGGAMSILSTVEMADGRVRVGEAE